MKNFEYCAYTYRHRRAVKYLVDKLITDKDLRALMLQRAENHDMDKMVMYQVLGRADAHRIHSLSASHHVTNATPKTYYDYLEAVLDYESAGYTKPDKPLNAHDFIIKMRDSGRFSGETSEELLRICADLGINTSYYVTDDIVGVEYLSQFDDVSEDMIIKELQEYFERSALQSNN